MNTMIMEDQENYLEADLFCLEEQFAMRRVKGGLRQRRKAMFE